VVSTCKPFTCGDKDLDDFFLNNTGNFDRQLLGKSFCYRLEKDPSVIVCAYTLSTSSVDARHLPRSRRDKLTEHVPHEKTLSSYPAALIGRLGVSVDFRGKGIGTELIENTIKPTFENFPIGCRFLTVDAYNNPAVMKFYEENGFKPLFSTEKQEKEHIGMSPEGELKTRLMFFDLIRLRAS
jgi:GNAT superfamily N-acetyltransferase